MTIRHTVRPGDSVSRLAERHGLAPETIWEHPDNEALRGRRERMDVLLPGDVVVIPARRSKTVSCALDRVHRFRRRGVPMRFEIQLFDERGDPRRDVAYVLIVDGVEHAGRTDSHGHLSQYIANGARRGRLLLDGSAEDLVLDFGHLDPIDALSGVQQRLTNLGFTCTQDEGALGTATRAALLRFQVLVGLTPSGDLDDATREEIRACHDDRERFAAHLERPFG